MEPLETRLNEVARIAARMEQQTGCPAQLLIAQAGVLTCSTAGYLLPCSHQQPPCHRWVRNANSTGMMKKA
jgi:hypothetical protein